MYTKVLDQDDVMKKKCSTYILLRPIPFPTMLLGPLCARARGQQNGARSARRENGLCAAVSYSTFIHNYIVVPAHCRSRGMYSSPYM